MMPPMQPGDEAPDFELRDQDDEPVRLSSLRGKPVVLYFYPKADTPGCTTQACGIRDRSGEYDAAGAVVLGVSPDKPAKLRKFADKYGLDFTLLADERARGGGELRHLGGEVDVRQEVHGRAARDVRDRPDGRIAHVLPKVSPKTHDDEVLAALSRQA